MQIDSILHTEIPLFERLAQSNKPILLYGMGDGAEKTLLHLHCYGIKPAGIFASDGFVRGQMFQGYRVTTYDEAKRSYPNMIVLVCFGTQREEVLRNIIQISTEQELYIPDVEVAGERIFDRAYAKYNKQCLQQVYQLLADQRSKDTLEHIVRFKLSGRLEELFASQSEERERPELLHLESDETFVDGGAYTGDTVQQFIQQVSTYHKIYAIEPDAKSYKKLVRNTQGLQDIQCLHMALGESNSVVSFNMQGGRQSVIASSGKQTVVTRKIDSIAPEASYIKLDVEGQEPKAIQGAVQTIKKNKPKLEIAAYHNNDHLLIPLLVQSIRNDYKIYMRRGRGIPAWHSYYYFV